MEKLIEQNQQLKREINSPNRQQMFNEVNKQTEKWVEKVLNNYTKLSRDRR